MQKDKEQLEEWELRHSAYLEAGAIIGFDKLTIAPPDGEAYRNKRESVLYQFLFEMETDPEFLSLLERILKDPGTDEKTRRKASCYHRDAMKILSVPPKEYREYQEYMGSTYSVWKKAKLSDDYALFEPYLKKNVWWKKKIAAYDPSEKACYDKMLDDFQPGMDTKQYDAFFTQVKERLIPLIRKVTKARQIDTSFLYLDYPVEKQRAFMGELVKYLRFDPSWGVLQETEHPFTTSICTSDCRTTTKYIENNVTSAIFSTIHEVGHAYYMHQVDPSFDGTILGDEGLSSGIHESQSRLCENFLGRSHAFWECNYPKLQDLFPSQLGNVTLDQFVDAVNASTPSLIRTDADELTYPIHILIRYEMEKDMIGGSIPLDHLDKVWDDCYEKYLGVRADKASEGILQDVHWADGSFGYFPTYALGTAYAAQFHHKMKSDIPLDEALRAGRYDVPMNWLKDHVHQYGNFYEAQEVLEKATGEPFNPSYYFDYLEEKYAKLYRL